MVAGGRLAGLEKRSHVADRWATQLASCRRQSSITFRVCGRGQHSSVWRGDQGPPEGGPAHQGEQMVYRNSRIKHGKFLKV